MKAIHYDISILSQPTETTCGPTCLQSIYQHMGLDVNLEEVINSVRYTLGGGTLGVLLALDAQKRNLQGLIYTHNLQVFDPTWFDLTSTELRNKLLQQAESSKEDKLKEASRYYAEYLSNGGEIRFEPLTPDFIYKTLNNYGPLVCGLSATYLYMSSREMDDTSRYDDIHGNPQGHFVIIKGMSADKEKVTIADPMASNPLAFCSEYTVDTAHFINSLLIGVITYDANIIALYQPQD